MKLQTSLKTPYLWTNKWAASLYYDCLPVYSYMCVPTGILGLEHICITKNITSNTIQYTEKNNISRVPRTLFRLGLLLTLPRPCADLPTWHPQYLGVPPRLDTCTRPLGTCSPAARPHKKPRARLCAAATDEARRRRWQRAVDSCRCHGNRPALRCPHCLLSANIARSSFSTLSIEPTGGRN